MLQGLSGLAEAEQLGRDAPGTRRKIVEAVSPIFIGGGGDAPSVLDGRNYGPRKRLIARAYDAGVDSRLKQ